MIHQTVAKSVALGLILAATLQGYGQVDSGNNGSDSIPVQSIESRDRSSYSSKNGKIVIGSLADDSGHGHVVVGVPGSDRVWDGNILGGFKDMLAGRDVKNQRVIDKMNLVVNQGQKSGTRGYQEVGKLSNDQLHLYADRYIKNGAPVTYSWQKQYLDDIDWYVVPTTQSITDVVRNYQPPVANTSEKQNLRCNDLAVKAAPDLQRLVMDDGASKRQVTPSANIIDRALQTAAERTKQAQTPQVQRQPDPNSSPLLPQINDSSNGNSARISPDPNRVPLPNQNQSPALGNMTNVVAPASRGPDGKQSVDPNKKQERLPDLEERKSLVPNISGRSPMGGTSAQPARRGSPASPKGPTIFDLERATLMKIRSQQAGILQGDRKEKNSQDSGTVKPGTRPEDDLDGSKKLEDAKLRKSGLVDEQKRSQEELASRKAEFEKEKKQLDSDKARLLQRETSAENMKKKAEDDKSFVQLERGNLGILKTSLDGTDGFLKLREAEASKDITAALKKVNYSKYNRCPEGHPWKECGHGDIKKKWLNEQLAAILGPARIAQIQQLKEQRDDYKKQAQELKDKETALEEKEEDANRILGETKEQVDAIRQERKALNGRATEMKNDFDKAKARVEDITKKIADVDTEITKYNSPQ